MTELRRGDAPSVAAWASDDRKAGPASGIVAMSRNGISLVTRCTMIPIPCRSSISTGNWSGRSMNPTAAGRRAIHPDGDNNATSDTAQTRWGTPRLYCRIATVNRPSDGSAEPSRTR